MIDLRDYGFERMNCLNEDNAARVTQVQRERYEVICGQGLCWARLKRAAFERPDVTYPTVGDFVTLEYNPAGDSRIVEVRPRRSFFARGDGWSARGSQAVAANFDSVFIVTSLNDEYRTRRLERYLAQARESGAQPVVILTKLDLMDAHSNAIEEARAAAGTAPVYAVSAHTGEGLEQLTPYLTRGQTIVLMGSSGVGKSSLVNALAGEEMMQTGEIREDDDRGRHTTTHRQMLMMPCGTAIIDTPGMRELGLWDSVSGVQETFEDLGELASRCRFRDCTHTREPGCAIRNALGTGQLDPARVKSYLQLQNEANITASRAERMAKKREKQKQISKFAKSIKANKTNLPR